ncbi:Iron siderophore sensor protein [Labilithrix luteola]|uniref:Iron siderophore sensor protein n=1 Tax=Labilithrix luteola TaxID=1391654 RepID=A0A0K1QDF9_9BACT|nr:FecR domain-containing protein [Labilithrix luteola]AKV03806.1 Iron siderophore sensor protein [Labilithrix luteola]
MNRHDVSKRVRDAASTIDVPWDDVREQRVLNGVLARRREEAAEPARTGREGARGRLVVLASATALLTAAAAAVVFFFVAHRPRVDDARTVASASASASASGSAESKMALADGSEAVLHPDAAIVVEEQEPRRVRIAQQRGRVRYSVKPNPAREFSVKAGDATVRVRGTIFTVVLSDDALEVSVERGRIEVERDGARRDVSAGESVRLSSPRTPDAPANADGAHTPGGHDAPTSSAAPPAEPQARPRQASVLLGAADLLAQADTARAAQKPAEAASALEAFVTAYPHDTRVPSALFSLGRVERSRGREAQAARAFERCLQAAPRGPLAEDALAEAATSYATAGMTERATTQARAYLDRYPTGSRIAQMKAILNP